MRLTVGCVALGIALAMAGCSAESDKGAPASTPAGTTPTAAGASASVEPQPTATASPAVPARPSQPVSTARRDCVASTEQATVRRESPGPICLVAGARLEVTSVPSPQRPWQPLSSSDSAVLSCASAGGPNGTVAGTCRALRAGTAVLSTTTGDRPGGPSGPYDVVWQLTVVVVT